jgi:peptidoglycan/xylan/chitin deacetylase (PgdA/CDA1 family)
LPSDPRVFLTFDDGPDAFTPEILDCLASHEARATFFVIGEKALAQRPLIAQVQKGGHAIGNHSWDHRYIYFFRREAQLKNWIADAHRRLGDLCGNDPIGFRSPAGVRTPPLGRALADLRIPLIHWSQRFFDTARLWTPDRAQRAVNRLSPGEIILLHDTQSPSRRPIFLKALEHFLRAGKARGFRFAPLLPEDLT